MGKGQGKSIVWSGLFLFVKRASWHQSVVSALDGSRRFFELLDVVVDSEHV